MSKTVSCLTHLSQNQAYFDMREFSNNLPFTKRILPILQ